MRTLLWTILILAALSGCASAPRAVGDGGVAALPAFVYFIHPAREGFIDEPTEEEAARVGEHFRYLRALTEQGVVVLAGPSLDPPYTGIVIFRATDRAAAETIMRSDPAVAAGVFTARLSPMRISLQSSTR